MTMAIQGGISPEEIIAFIQQHTEDYSAQIKGEMQAAQDRTALIKDIADLAAKMEDFKTRKEFGEMHDAIDEFLTTHKEAWGGHEHDMAVWIAHTQTWAGKHTIKPNTYVQTNHPDATTGGSSFYATWGSEDNFNDDGIQQDIQNIVSGWIQQLNNWKDQVSSDDKIGMMKLQEDADRLKNLYELGSNLISKVDGCASAIISNIGRA